MEVRAMAHTTRREYTGENSNYTILTAFRSYVYFEKRRILEGKKKTAGRQRNEKQLPRGFPTETPRGRWVRGR